MAADGEHKVLRFFLAVGVVAAFTAALARWLRGPSTEAFTEPSIWPPAKSWPPLDEAAPEEPQHSTAAPEEAAPRRRVQVVKQSGTASDAGKKSVSIAATDVTAPTAPATWKAGSGGACPDGYPIKAKVRSGLYHEPGMLAYERTNPDRCYPSGDAAEADGFTRAKR